MSEIKIEGLADLHKMMQELPAKIEANVLRGGMRAGAKVIEEEAKRLAPVESGALRDSIRVSVRSRNGKVEATIKAGDSKTKKLVENRPDGSVKVTYRNAWYARLVEFGTAQHYIKAIKAKALILRSNRRASSGFAKRWTSWIVEGVTHPGAKRKPFMRPALDTKAQQAVQTLADYIRDRLPKEFRKAGK